MKDKQLYIVIAAVLVIAIAAITMAVTGVPIFNYLPLHPLYWVAPAFIVWALLEGSREATYEYFKLKSKTLNSYNEHVHWTIQRSMVMLFLLAFIGWIPIIALAFMFTFFHDGFYYLLRNELDTTIYKKRWWDQSDTSTSWMDTKHLTTPIIRTVMAVMGLIIYVLNIIYG